MLAVTKIAWRNLGKNLRRSSLLALAIFLCTTILLVAFFAFNGAERQMLSSYVNVQSGDVVLVWDDLAQSDKTSPQRFINVGKALTYDPDETGANNAALEAASQWLDDHSELIQHQFPVIRRNATLKANDRQDLSFLTYSLSSDQRDFLVDSGSVQLAEGRFAQSGANEVVICESKAQNLQVGVGDAVELVTTTDSGDSLTTRLEVSGIYQDGAFYDNFYGFLDIETAHRVYGIPDRLFDSMLIFLHDRESAQSVADDLQGQLHAAGDVLHAESYLAANSYYNNTPELIRMVFGGFIIFVLLIIAFGMQSSIKLSLHQRMREIGSMRAMGFSKASVYTMIFAETFFLSAVAFIPAVLVAFAFVLVFGAQGVFVGEAASALFGGQYFYPSVQVPQIAFVLVIMMGFALFATILPGLRMVNQRIVDMMNRNPKSARERKREAELV